MGADGHGMSEVRDEASRAAPRATSVANAGAGSDVAAIAADAAVSGRGIADDDSNSNVDRNGDGVANGELRSLGLTQRTVLLLLAVVLASLAIVAVGFELERRANDADQFDARARGLAALVHTARSMLQSVPAADREQLSAGLMSSGTLQVFAASRVVLPQSPAVPVMAMDGEARLLLGDALLRYATPPAEVLYRDAPSPRYWVSQVIDGERWWIVVPVGEPPPPPGGVPWAALGIVLLLMLVAAATYAATIARPVRELALATRRVGASWPEPVPLHGPRELRELGASFNAMLERLRQVEEERYVLIGGLPHDLRAPLARLRLRLAMLPEGADAAGIGADLASIERIVRQFNDYLQGSAAPEAERVAIGELVEAAIAPHRSLGREVYGAWPADSEPRVPPLAVRRLLDNLIDNAFRHGRGPVSVQALAGKPDGLMLRVTDAGPGIPLTAGATALEPFTKLDPSRGRGGCGLGLAIVRQIARELGGQVYFEGGAGAFTVAVKLRASPG